MSDPQFDVERATGGLVLALFLAASLLLGAMYYFILRDTGKRAEETRSSAQAVVRGEHPPCSDAVSPSAVSPSAVIRRYST
jgi:hypothetical protein